MMKSPLGIEPRYLWDERRMIHLYNAIQRFSEANTPVPQEWIEEYNELRNRYLNDVEVERT